MLHPDRLATADTSLPIALLACVSLVACSGASVAPISDRSSEAGAEATANPRDGAPGSGDDHDGAAGGRDAGAESCAALESELAAAEDRLRECCPTCRSVQCQHTIHALCCPFSSNVSPQSKEAKEYAELVRAFRDAKCGNACTAVVCDETPARRCVDLGDGRGICQP